ncbi:hypothetical protein CerSpe_169020 [Prunus speciosa]
MASSSSHDDLPLPSFSNAVTVRLDRNNYPLWIAQILPLLRSRRLLSFIDGSSVCPSAFVLDDTGKPTDTVNTAYEDIVDPKGSVGPLMDQWVSQSLRSHYRGSLYFCSFYLACT